MILNCIRLLALGSNRTNNKREKNLRNHTVNITSEWRHPVNIKHSLANRHSVQLRPKRVTESAHIGRRQGGYDQSDFSDVIILLIVIVSLFCWKNNY